MNRSKKQFLFAGIILVAWSLSFYCWQNQKLQLFTNAQTESYKAVDARSLEEAARKLYLNGFEADLNRTPAYPLLIGLPLLINISTEAWAVYIQVVNVLCWLLCIVLLYTFISKRTNALFGFTAAFLISALVGLSALTNEALTESLFVLLLSILLVQLDQVMMEGKRKNLVWLGLTALLLYLTRPVFLIPLLVFLLMVLIHGMYLYLKNQSVKWHMATLVIVTGLLGLHMLNLKRSTGNAGLSSLGNRASYVFLGAKAWCLKTNNPDVHAERNKRDRQLDTLAYRERNAFIDSIAIADLKWHLKNNAANLVKVLYTNITYDNGSFGSSNIHSLDQVTHKEEGKTFYERRDLFYSISEWQNYLLTRLSLATGCIFLLLFIPFRKKRTAWYYLILALLILYLIGISGISFWQGDRFHVVVFPVTITLVSLALYKIISFIKILFSAN